MRRIAMIFGTVLSLLLSHHDAGAVDISSERRSQVTACVEADQTAADAIGLLKERLDSGFVVLAGKEGVEHFRYHHGGLAFDQPLNIASASKIVTALMVMMLIDRGEFSLETTVGEFFPGLDPKRSSITVRQLLSHTSGISGALVRKDVQDGTVQQLAERLLSAELLFEPGTSFDYGGSSMQVVGAMSERATQKSWSQLFSELLGEHLEISSAGWGRPLVGPGVPPERMASGLFISANDYAKIMGALARGGSDLLSESSVSSLFQEQVGFALGPHRPAVLREDTSYALGSWCERFADFHEACDFVHSAGAWGTLPWIDRRDGSWGIIFVFSRLSKIYDAERELVSAIEHCDQR